jgi:hypothetical protein
MAPMAIASNKAKSRNLAPDADRAEAGSES